MSGASQGHAATDDAGSQLALETVAFLMRLLEFPSTPGNERDAVDFLETSFAQLCDRVERCPFPAEFVSDPEYSFPVEGLRYEGRHNLRVVWNEGAEGPTLLFNTHVDVVPPSRGQTDAFAPRREGNTVFARGACDAKGQIATLFELLRRLNDLPMRPAARVVLHLVVEEENGGNGTLGFVRRGERADAAVVLEPTGRRPLTSVRGAVWFRLRFSGQASHSGQSELGRSALDLAIEAKRRIERYHAALLSESAGQALFEEFANPMPLTFGKLHAGTWPAMVADSAALEGVMGFLPNRTRERIMTEIEEAARADDPAMACEIEFMYRHDCHVLPTEHPWARCFASALATEAAAAPFGAMPASCDSWFYNNLLDIPTIVYGPGELAHAHTATERIDLNEIARAGRTLTRVVERAADGGLKR